MLSCQSSLLCLLSGDSLLPCCFGGCSLLGLLLRYGSLLCRLLLRPRALLGLLLRDSLLLGCPSILLLLLRDHVSLLGLWCKNRTPHPWQATELCGRFSRTESDAHRDEPQAKEHWPFVLSHFNLPKVYCRDSFPLLYYWQSARETDCHHPRAIRARVACLLA